MGSSATTISLLLSIPSRDLDYITLEKRLSCFRCGVFVVRTFCTPFIFNVISLSVAIWLGLDSISKPLLGVSVPNLGNFFDSLMQVFSIFFDARL